MPLKYGAFRELSNGEDRFGEPMIDEMGALVVAVRDAPAEFWERRTPAAGPRPAPTGERS